MSPHSRRSAASARPEPAGGYGPGLLLGSGVIVAGLIAAAVWLGRSPSPATWYLARSSGIVLYLLAWIAVVSGLGLTSALANRWAGRGLAFSLHAFATELAYGLLALHLLSLAADPEVRFGPRALLVPFASGWREPWTGIGVLAAALIVLVGASFALKRFIGQRAWRALHWFSFPLYALALAHAIGSGTDRASALATALYLGTATVVVLLCCYRLLRRGARTDRSAADAAPLGAGSA